MHTQSHIIMAKYNVPFSGENIETTVTNKASAVDEWVQEIRRIHNGKNIILGLDCEWRCTDYWGYANKVVTLQICVGNKCLILQMAYLDAIPASLKHFLMESTVTCVGVEVDEDVARLRNEYGIACAKTADIRALASTVYSFDRIFGRKPGLKDLAWLGAGLHMEKPRNVCKSDWQARVLVNEQIKYACIDAYVSYWIGCKLLSN